MTRNERYEPRNAPLVYLLLDYNENGAASGNITDVNFQKFWYFKDLWQMIKLIWISRSGYLKVKGKVCFIMKTASLLDAACAWSSQNYIKRILGIKEDTCDILTEVGMRTSDKNDIRDFKLSKIVAAASAYRYIFVMISGQGTTRVISTEGAVCRWRGKLVVYFVGSGFADLLREVTENSRKYVLLVFMSRDGSVLDMTKDSILISGTPELVKNEDEARSALIDIINWQNGFSVERDRGIRNIIDYCVSRFDVKIMHERRDGRERILYEEVE